MFRGQHSRAMSVAGGVLGLAAMIACGKQPSSESAEPAGVAVKVQAARLGDIADALTATGTIVPATAADWTITAAEPAQIASMPKIEGQAVAIGDELVRFEIPSLSDAVATKQAETASASARVDQLKADVAKSTALFEQGLLPRLTLEAQKSALVDAQTALLHAKTESDAVVLQAKRQTITARFPGIVVKQWRHEGDFVGATPDEPILRVIDPTRVQISVQLSAAEITKVNAGQRAVVRPPAGADEAATVVFRPLVPDPTARTVEARLGFTAPTLLPIDTAVEVQITLDERLGVIVVPRAALLREDGATYVVLAGADDRAHRQDVRIGLITNALVQIVSGVNAGDRVVVTGLEQLGEGTPLIIGG